MALRLIGLIGTKSIIFDYAQVESECQVMAMQRRANWIPVIVSDRAVPSDGYKNVSLDEAVVELAFPALLAPDVGGLSENNANSLDQENQRQADLRFAIAVAITLALPMFIGFGVYVAAESIMLIASRISFVG
jgi:hypothetical protein